MNNKIENVNRNFKFIYVFFFLNNSALIGHLPNVLLNKHYFYDINSKLAFTCDSVCLIINSKRVYKKEHISEHVALIKIVRSLNSEKSI